MSKRSERKDRKGSKRAAQFAHAQRRALTRYGLELSPEVHEQIIAKIFLNGSTLVEKQSGRISVHDIKLGDVTYRVVYDCSRKVLVTFLHREENALYGV